MSMHASNVCMACMHLCMGNREKFERAAVCVNVFAYNVQAERHNTHALFCSLCLSVSCTLTNTYAATEVVCVDMFCYHLAFQRICTHNVALTTSLSNSSLCICKL